MSWREVIVDSPCKISVSGNYLILRGDCLKRIHLSEIGILLISNTSVNITAVSIVELINYKVKVIFCDEKHNPCAELASFYGCHNTSKKILQQTAWSNDTKATVHTYIIHQKILNQANLLNKVGFCDRANMLYSFANEIELNDSTNREGHAAKVYFNTLFGTEFNRDLSSDINSALNYGYSILLSLINREIVANGCITQLGINHCNEYNQFNFGCDLIEPFRVVIDEFVLANRHRTIDKAYKYELIDLLNVEVQLDRKTTLMNAVKKSVKSIIDALNSNDLSLMLLFQFV